MKLMVTIEKNLPEGFEKSLDRNMLAYSIPLATYSDAKHTATVYSDCTSKTAFSSVPYGHLQ